MPASLTTRSWLRQAATPRAAGDAWPAKDDAGDDDGDDDGRHRGCQG